MSNLCLATSDGQRLFSPAASLGQDAVLTDEQAALLETALNNLRRACGALQQAEVALCALGADYRRTSTALESLRSQTNQTVYFIARCEARAILARRGADKGQVIATT